MTGHQGPRKSFNPVKLVAGARAKALAAGIGEALLDELVVALKEQRTVEKYVDRLLTSQRERAEKLEAELRGQADKHPDVHALMDDGTGCSLSGQTCLGSWECESVSPLVVAHSKYCRRLRAEHFHLQANWPQQVITELSDFPLSELNALDVLTKAGLTSSEVAALGLGTFSDIMLRQGAGRLRTAQVERNKVSANQRAELRFDVFGEPFIQRHPMREMIRALSSMAKKAARDKSWFAPILELTVLQLEQQADRVPRSVTIDDTCDLGIDDERVGDSLLAEAPEEDRNG